MVTFKHLNESFDNKFDKLLIESFNPNRDFTKETLWRLRQEVPIGSLYTNDFENSFGIPARACQDFFDGYMDELDYMMQEDGLYEDGYDKAFWDHLDEYDNADNLWDWYNVIEQPFGEDFEIEDDDEYDEALDKSKFKRVKQPSKKPIKESAEDIASSFKGYKAFASNFKPIKIVKKGKTYFVYRDDAKDEEDYEYYSDSKDNIEGFLAGAVKAKNKRFGESLDEARMYDLTPQRDSRKSFYGKAKVMINDDDSETLYSYDTPIMTRTKDGNYKKHWDGWSNTTGRHIAEFSGMDKKKYSELPVEESIKRKRNK